MTQRVTNDGFEDDEMDMSDDGGVYLDQSEPNVITYDQGSLESSDATVLYHQRLVTETDRPSYSWKLPLTLANYRSNPSKHRINHPVAMSYLKHCKLITKHWGCDPEECIPPEMRSRTPYSLAMLSSLRQLASTTKGNFEGAQAILMEAWQSRISMVPMPEGQDVLLIETLVDPIGAALNSEDRIQENILGLICKDVDEVRRTLRHQELKAKKAKKAEKVRKSKGRAARKLFGEEPQARIADRVVKNRRAAKLASPQWRAGDQLVGVEFGTPPTQISFAAPPNSPASPSFRSSMPSVDDVLRQIEGGGPDDYTESSPIVTGEVRQQDRHMSRILDNIAFDKPRGVHKKRRRRLQAGGFSRVANQKVAMPSEKLELSSIPSLQEATELASIGQFPLPSPTTFELPVRSTRNIPQATD